MISLKNTVAMAHHLKSARVDLVCDSYPEISIKNIERGERVRGGITLVRINGDDQKMPRQFKFFLSAGPNKVALVDFIFDLMVRNLDKNVIRMSVTSFSLIIIAFS